MDLTTEQVEERVLECFRAVFPTLSDDELRALSQQGNDDWDSLASLSLITVIEEEFDIVLDDDTVARLDTFAAVRAAVASPPG